MATEVASAYVALLPSFRGGSAAISRELGGPLDAAGRDGGTRFGGGMRTGIAGMAARVFAPLAAAAAGVSLVGFFRGAVEEASGLGESVNALNVVFGDASSGIQELGRGASQALGLSNLDFNNLAVQFSNFAQTVAGPGGDVTKTLGDLTTRAADFASVMNLDVADAATLFQSGLAGETEPLRRYGIDMSAATVQAYAYANGIGVAGSELTEAQKVQARYGLLMASTAVTQGDFANTAGSLANQQRILGASWSDLTVKVGTMFLPVITAAVTLLNEHVVPAISGALDAFSAAGGGMDGVVVLWQNAVDGLGGWLAGGGFAAILDGLISGRERMVELILTLVPQVVEALAAALPEMVSWIAGTLIPMVVGSLRQLVPMLLGILPGLLDAIVGMLPDLLDAALDLFGALIEAVVVIVPELIDTLLGILPGLVSTLLGMLPRLIQSALGLFMGLVQGLVQALPVLLNTLFGTVLPQLITTLLTMLPGIIMAAVDLFMGLVTGLLTMLPDLITTLVDLLPVLLVTLVEMIPQLIEASIQLFTALATALIAFTPQLLDLIVRLIPQIVVALVNGQTALWNAGWQLLVGLWDGLVAKWPSIKTWFAEIPGKIIDGLGNLRQILLDAGRQIMAGLWDGLKDRWGDVQDWVGDLGDWIADHKGPRSVDLRLLAPAGGWIMQGLRDGLEAQLPALRATLSQVTDEIAATPGRFAASASLATSGDTTAAGGASGSAGGVQFHVHDVGDPYANARALIRVAMFEGVAA